VAISQKGRRSGELFLNLEGERRNMSFGTGVEKQITNCDFVKGTNPPLWGKKKSLVTKRQRRRLRDPRAQRGSFSSPSISEEEDFAS